MKKVNLISRADMRKVLGGNAPAEGEIGGGGENGRCVWCDCHDGRSSCWYSRRSSHDLCVAVCGDAYFNALDPGPCTGCTMN